MLEVSESRFLLALVEPMIQNSGSGVPSLGYLLRGGDGRGGGDRTFQITLLPVWAFLFLWGLRGFLMQDNRNLGLTI